MDTASHVLASELVTPSLVKKLNEICSSVELAESFKENIITYNSVLTKGAYSPAQYVSAVQYVSYRLMGQTSTTAWQKTFPDRYAVLLSKGANSKTIGSHASAYNRTKIVSTITEQSLVPSHVANFHYHQEALEVQVGIMRDETVGAKTRSDASKVVLEFTSMPEALISNKEEISGKGLDIIAELARSVKTLAESKQTSIIEGKTTAKALAAEAIYVDGVLDE